ncbi:unnamed protein product [Acanthoscelides obtectus]|uniref:C3H1-type domain-containing protein n=1 Tax=Acanthoscelides obtectus TaxID=200917 RepID=A0A9P0KZU9_ACAOB|nr:unnamed protein product [Acanthoscelides obtectus]CAK1681867.1 hypothetical protein AOBTE_LOCUS33318 [Acanthoscelides obtectus]
MKMSKQTNRKITVSLTTTKSKSRPSVFERLGTKACSVVAVAKDYCHHWAQTGSCPYGKGCKYAVTHTLTSPSKQRQAAAKGTSVIVTSGGSSKRSGSTSRLVSNTVQEILKPAFCLTLACHPKDKLPFHYTFSTIQF